MIVQDTLTGTLHEVPDGQVYESEFGEYPYQMGEPVYDGLGNPVGFLPFLPKIASLAASFLPKVGGMLRGLLPGGGGAPAQALMPGGMMPGPMMPRPMPPGWTNQPGYPGYPSHLVYMKCRSYRRPPGLVPVFATQPPPAVALPAAAAAAAAAQTAAQMGRGRRRGRRRR
ncbi:MAG TPA: hypothetical protein VGD61_15420 [Pyrinomonadaceae bacterium]